MIMIMTTTMMMINYYDVIRILIMKSRAGQFLNMKNWDDSTNYAIPIARCDGKCALIERAEFYKKS